MTRLSPLARTSTVAALSLAVVAAAANAGPNRAVEPGTTPRHQPVSVLRDGTVPPIQVVSTAWLAEHINDPDLVVLQIERSAMHREPTIPGARVLPYSTMSVAREGLTTELPSPDSLVRLFEGVGISDSTLVVVTSSFEAPMASRALMSLDYLGHQRLAFLDGGVMQWRLEKRAMSQAAPNVTRGRITARVREDLVVDASWISERIADGAIALIDT